ncbi:MAG: prolipoprotein diacylglyceryl transferase [Reichenbachiella sp.]|uniref:prolipoprotein diacylglyceryl transferase n=1 Tax=Reichenbachiella sp. TaxID=2184521 RepID=UPI0032652E97
MTSILEFIIWSPSPEMFTIPIIEREVRWYGLLFAMGFIVAQQVMYWIFKREGKDPKDVDQLTLYLVIAVVVGARLGHCLFYSPGYYLSNPIEIFKIWEGGLASHGGAIGMFIALYLYAKNYGFTYLWILDRVAIVTVLVGAFIRFGNYMNSEIIGLPTGTDSGVVFARSVEDMFLRGDERVENVSFEKGGKAKSDSAGLVPMTIVLEYKRGIELDETSSGFFERSVPNALSRGSIRKHIFYEKGLEMPYDLYKSGGVQYAKIHVLGVPRHPGQLYESIACILMFLILAHVWYYHRSRLKAGFLFGFFMTMLWSERFFVEFFKENQESWEADIPLNMGQWLSIPLFLWGVTFMIKFWGFGKKTK